MEVKVRCSDCHNETYVAVQNICTATCRSCHHKKMVKEYLFPLMDTYQKKLEQEKHMISELDITKLNQTSWMRVPPPPSRRLFSVLYCNHTKHIKVSVRGKITHDAKSFLQLIVDNDESSVLSDLYSLVNYGPGPGPGPRPIVIYFKNVRFYNKEGTHINTGYDGYEGTIDMLCTMRITTDGHASRSLEVQPSQIRLIKNETC